MIESNIYDSLSKPNLLMRFGCFISIVGITYKMFGIKGCIGFYINKLKLDWFFWKFKHCKRFRERITKEVKYSPALETILMSMFLGKPLDLESFYKSLTDKEKEEFKKSREKAINDTIKKYNITDETEIARLRDMYNFNDD